MSKTVQVSYNAETIETSITVDGQPFDTARINGKEIADWAYPFMVRKVRWDGFYEEMVSALGGEKAFDLVFEGSDEALAELKEAWENAPVNVVSGKQGNTVTIIYDADALTTEITVNGQPFDTARINGKEIEDWVYPFMMRKVKWDGIFDELKNVLGTDEYDILFSGTRVAMKVLMEDCPENVTISYQKADSSNASSDPKSSDAEILFNKAAELYGQKDYAQAVKYYLQAAEMGYAPAQCALGDCYDEGNGTAQDQQKAFEWYRKAANQSFAEGQRDLGLCYYYGDGTAQNYHEAVKWLMLSAEQNDAIAQWVLGQCYENGTGVEADAEQAFRLYQKSAEQSDPDGMYYYACCFLSGIGTEKDVEKGEEWLKKAAVAGSEGAAYILADDADSTSEVPSDSDNEALELEKQANELFQSERYAEAFPLRKQAADMGNIIAIGNLGAHYQYGYGVEQDDETALKYYQKAADMGSSWAQVKTGIMYNNGYGCAEDEETAFSYFMRAAEQEESEAQYWVGMCYKNGWGVPENSEKAYSWFSKSHKNGYLGGARELASCLWNGFGIAANRGRAKGLWNEAANMDDAASAYLLGEAHIEEGKQNKAFFYLNKAYKLGCRDAAGSLALCLEMGWGIQKNYRKAVEVLEENLDVHPEYYVQLGKIFFPIDTEYHNYTRAAQYFQRAVDHEYVEGYFMLGICYSEGYGVPKNKERAKELLQVAADNGHTSAQDYLNSMAKKEGYIDTAKKIGQGALGFLGAIAQGYVQAASMYDDDEDDYE